MTIIVTKPVHAVTRGGFTFMEIMATMLLIGLILPVAMKGISIATVLASDSIRRQEALGLAENRLAEVLLNEEWTGGDMGGRFDRETLYGMGYRGTIDYQWKLETKDWIQSGLKQLDLTVLWEHRQKIQEVRITTLVYNNAE